MTASDLVEFIYTNEAKTQRICVKILDGRYDYYALQYKKSYGLKTMGWLIDAVWAPSSEQMRLIDQALERLKAYQVF